MTSYEEVYSSLRDKITDPELAQCTDLEEQELLYGYMKSAIARFGRSCKKLDDRDDILQMFNQDLSVEEVDILSEAMLEAWAKPKYYNSENLWNALSTKDYSIHSPANLLGKIKELYKDAQKDSKSMINEYSILNSGFSELKTRKI